MSNSFMWFQPAILKENDIVTKNGEILPIGEERMNSFQQIKKYADKAIKKNRPWCGKFGNYFFLKGTLNGKDELGRTLCFLFTTDKSDYKKALDEELLVINYKLDEATLQCVSSYKPLHMLKFLTICGFVLVALLIFMYYSNIFN